MHLPELTTHLTEMFTEDNLRIYVDANRDLDKIVILITSEDFDGDLKCLGIFVELLSQLQQFKAASSARFPTATQKRALAPRRRPLPRGAFFEVARGDANQRAGVDGF
jgi:hypothetical protein